MNVLELEKSFSKINYKTIDLIWPGFCFTIVVLVCLGFYYIIGTPKFSIATMFYGLFSGFSFLLHGIVSLDKLINAKEYFIKNSFLYIKENSKRQLEYKYSINQDFFIIEFSDGSTKKNNNIYINKNFQQTLKQIKFLINELNKDNL